LTFRSFGALLNPKAGPVSGKALAEGISENTSSEADPATPSAAFLREREILQVIRELKDSIAI
jgi:hypothetical protein